jgi:glutathione S-transferase
MARMLTVHHLETSRSQRVLWLLEELGVPYDLRLYRRDPRTKLAPASLKAVHPLGKSPVITDGDDVIAESGAIIEYLAERFARGAPTDLAHLVPKPGTPEHRQCRFWMHYAEGSLMNWLVMKLVFLTIPTQPMPFFVRPIARTLCDQVQKKLIDPNLSTALDFMEGHLAQAACRRWRQCCASPACADRCSRRPSRVRRCRCKAVRRPAPCAPTGCCPGPAA